MTGKTRSFDALNLFTYLMRWRTRSTGDAVDVMCLRNARRRRVEERSRSLAWMDDRRCSAMSACHRAMSRTCSYVRADLEIASWPIPMSVCPRARSHRPSVYMLNVYVICMCWCENAARVQSNNQNLSISCSRKLFKVLACYLYYTWNILLEILPAIIRKDFFCVVLK